MKSKYVILASALLISVATFAQKDQIKAAEKALKGGNSAEAVTLLQGAESLIPNATDAEKAQFFFVKGNALLDLANKNVETGKNLSLAAKAYQDLLAVEKTSGKNKYSSQATTSIIDIKYKLINAAVADSKIDKHLDSAQKLYDAYLLDKKDTINLYYAASSYVNAKEYDKALKLYEDLKTLNYSGKGVNYFATNKLTGEENSFPSAQERDKMVKITTHEKPRTEIVPSKRGEIYKNIALILVQNGKTEEAKKAISDARKANPEDTSLILTEANLYLETKDFETYKKLIAQALEKNPNDADLVFNLGVISANAKNPVEAEKYYKRVIEINPNYINAYINLAALKLENEKVIIDEMNKLGTSAKDMKRYDELKNKRFDLFRSTIPYLVKAVELNPTNIDVAKTLLNVYSALEMTAEYKALKGKIKE
ncbi:MULTISPECIES: tetratricopeptide repeat protein [unclassified Flavobacterium]|jgi:tetratricopeptide (TPR) repeat protein|uniref:tetratricopeptide repeat protein n=1 Tax=unclassified Flavobacterium TaxID=196869 RepID=UPI0025BE6416|nr:MULTISPECIES: tetratricopeptide repeat protein [unclassified Flavobacterium]